MFPERFSGENKRSPNLFPRGYSVNELKALSEKELSELCTVEGLDFELVKENLAKAEVLPAGIKIDSELSHETKHNDVELIKKIIFELSKSAVEVTYDLSELRAQADSLKENSANKNETLTDLESRMDRIVDYMNFTGEDSSVLTSGVRGAYKSIFSVIALESFDRFMSEGKTETEALTEARSSIKNKFNAKTIKNIHWGKAYSWAFDNLVFIQKADATKVDFCDLLKRFLENNVNENEREVVNRILRATKGLSYRGRHSTYAWPVKYVGLKNELSDIYQKNSPLNTLDPTEVTSADVFDANYQILPDDVKNNIYLGDTLDNRL